MPHTLAGLSVPPSLGSVYGKMPSPSGTVQGSGGVGGEQAKGLDSLPSMKTAQVLLGDTKATKGCHQT